MELVIVDMHFSVFQVEFLIKLILIYQPSAKNHQPSAISKGDFRSVYIKYYAFFIFINVNFVYIDQIKDHFSVEFTLNDVNCF